MGPMGRLLPHSRDSPTSRVRDLPPRLCALRQIYPDRKMATEMHHNATADIEGQRNKMDTETEPSLYNRYSSMLQKEDLHDTDGQQSQFLEELSNNIIQGEARKAHVKAQLHLLVQNGKTELLAKHPEGSLNVMQLAAFFHEDAELIEMLARLCPDLIWKQRSGEEYKGQTVLHIIIIKENTKAAEAILSFVKSLRPTHDRLYKLLNSRTETGSRFDWTVMMGELPLSVAALTFNREMVDKLVKHGARIYNRNSHGDTVLHTLVLFAACYPNKLEDVRQMIMHLHKLLQDKANLPDPEAEARDVWLMENREKLTVLKLTAFLAQSELFTLVLNLQGVYCHLDGNDGLFDSLMYDVTEVDPVALRIFRADSSNEAKEPTLTLNEERAKVPSRSAILTSMGLKFHKERIVSVLDFACEMPKGEKAFGIINTAVVRGIIKQKWDKYKRWFGLWAVLHLLFMTLFTAYAVYKARVISDHKSPQTNQQTTAPERDFVEVMKWLTLVMPISLVLICFGVLVKRWKEISLPLLRLKLRQVKLPHHNGLYHLMLVVIFISMFADSIWFFAAGPDNNYILVLTLLLTYWFGTFFLRPFKKFSFYTVMLRKVLYGDLVRFSTMIILEWMAFSVAMHITYLATPAPGAPDEFKDLWVSMLTMFKLMLGLSEIDVLYESCNQWLVIILFIVFTLVTYVLLLNALIAMMSSTCSSVAENRESHWKLQRLSVVLMLESILRLVGKEHNSGRKEQVARYNIKNCYNYTEQRFFLKVTEAQTKSKKSETESPGTKPSDNVQPSGHTAHLDLLQSFATQKARLASTILPLIQKKDEGETTEKKSKLRSAPGQKRVRPSTSVREEAGKGEQIGLARSTNRSKKSPPMTISPDVFAIHPDLQFQYRQQDMAK